MELFDGKRGILGGIILDEDQVLKCLKHLNCTNPFALKKWQVGMQCALNDIPLDILAEACQIWPPAFKRADNPWHVIIAFVSGRVPEAYIRYSDKGIILSGNPELEAQLKEKIRNCLDNVSEEYDSPNVSDSDDSDSDDSEDDEPDLCASREVIKAVYRIVSEALEVKEHDIPIRFAHGLTEDESYKTICRVLNSDYDDPYVRPGDNAGPSVRKESEGSQTVDEAPEPAE